MSAKTIKGITVEIGGKTTKLGEALKDATKQSSELQNSLKLVNKALKMDPTSVELLTQKQKVLADAVKAAKDRLKTLEEAQAQVAEQYRNGDIDQGAYLEFQNQLEQARRKVQDLEAEQRKFSSVVGQTMQEAGRQISAFGEKLTSAGEALTKNVSAPIVAAGAASVGAFKQVDEGLDTIVTATGASGEALEGLRASYENIATEVPADFATIGAAVGEVNTRFQTTGKTLEDQTTLFLQFAKITGGDVVTAVDTSDKVLESWGRTIEDLPGLLGMTAKAAQDTGINAQGLLDTVQSNGASFRQLGFSLEETIQLLAQMDANGVESSTAITGLKKAVTNLTDAGMSESDALRAVIDGIKNAKTETEALEAAQEVFGTRGAAEMVSAIREGRFSLDGLSASMADYGTVVQDTYAGTVDGIDSLKTTANAGMLALSEFGSVISDMLAPVLQKTTEYIKGVTEKLKGMDDGQKKTIVTIAGLVAAVGPALAVFGKITTGVGGFITKLGQLPTTIQTVKAGFTAFSGVLSGGLSSALSGVGTALGFLTSPAGLVVAAIAAVVAGFVLLYNKCEGFRNLVNSVVDGVKAKFEEIKTKVANVMPAVQSAFSAGMEAVRNTASNVMEAARATVKEKLDNMRSAYEENGGGIKGIVAASMEGVKGYFTAGMTFVDNLTGGALTNIKNTITEKMTTAANMAREKLEQARGAFAEKFPQMHSVCSSIMGAITATTQTNLGNMLAAYNNAGGGMRGAVSAAMEGIKGFFTSGYTFINNLTGNRLAEIVGKFSTLEGARSTVAGVFEGIRSAIADKIEAARQAVQSAIDRIKSAFNFSWSLPPLKLPHFSISGSFSLNPPSVPHLSVSWYRKGAILQGAQIFGNIDDTLLGGGEAGPEAVLPLAGFYRQLAGILDAKLSDAGNIYYTQNCQYNSPKDLTPAEAARQTRNDTRKALAAFRRK